MKPVARIDYALIGAAAMAVHGVSRATADVDFFTVDTKVLDKKLWNALESQGANLRLLKGNSDDPLAGNVRLSVGDEEIVDVVVGRHAWQREIIDSSERLSIGEVTVRVARPAGLVLLKLYAGGPKDAWDVPLTVREPRARQSHPHGGRWDGVSSAARMQQLVGSPARLLNELLL